MAIAGAGLKQIPRQERRIIEDIRILVEKLTGNTDNKDFAALTQKELIDLGILARDRRGNLVNALTSSTSTITNVLFRLLEETFFLGGSVTTAVFTIGAEAANVINVGVQLRNGNNENIPDNRNIIVYLADSSDGSDYVGTAPSGAVAIGTDGVLIDLTGAKKIFSVISDSSGVFDINITEGGAKTLYMVVAGSNNIVITSAAITFV